MTEDKKIDVIIVGAGPAGLGVAVLLKKLEVDFVILEKDDVGSSFVKWPKETRFISPSFTGNFFKMADLNAITPDTSPAFSLLTEHPKGEDYVVYLKEVSRHHDLPINRGVNVTDVQSYGDHFDLTTNQGTYASKYLIWAAGEFQYPRKNNFQGSDLCLHYSEITRFSELKGDELIIIGAYESGFDAMVNLAQIDKKVVLLDSSNYLDLVKSDSSYCLSPFTRDRTQETIDRLGYDQEAIDYHPYTRVTSVAFENGQYFVKTNSGETFTSTQRPINCTGFDSSLTLISDLFHFNEEGYPVLNKIDESVKTKNLFLAGPQVKHKNALFCFIYKYRQRFAIVAEAIAGRKRTSPLHIKKVLKKYKDLNFYLKDLSCCDGECVC
ncbi:MAG: NAD(P)-binding domain-containing protein [Cyclobacteriaceae bacterium]|nr:NAD(P)-binding domain-containing protein [Cyclobacteriaceae bacterium HetDA_MAG_MS6]